MGKLLARLARNFRRKFVTRRLVAICLVLRRRNWNSATLVVLNKHLAITRQIQTLGHAVLPYARPFKETWRECEPTRQLTREVGAFLRRCEQPNALAIVIAVAQRRVVRSRCIGYVS
jgi:hypothetical protein